VVKLPPGSTMMRTLRSVTARAVSGVSAFRIRTTDFAARLAENDLLAATLHRVFAKELGSVSMNPTRSWLIRSS